MTHFSLRSNDFPSNYHHVRPSKNISEASLLSQNLALLVITQLLSYTGDLAAFVYTLMLDVSALV